MLVLLFCMKTAHAAHLFEAFCMLDLHKKKLFQIFFIKMSRHDNRKRIFMVEKYHELKSTFQVIVEVRISER